jgi:hypothetical protein
VCVTFVTLGRMCVWHDIKYDIQPIFTCRKPELTTPHSLTTESPTVRFTKPPFDTENFVQKARRRRRNPS